MADNKILQAILDKISTIESKMSSLESKVDKGFKELTNRIDSLGLQIANLEDDAPTVAEFDGLEKRVKRLENQIPQPNAT